MKSVFKSKTVWFNIFYTVAEVTLIVQEVLNGEYMLYAITIHGIANLILRVWFTSTAVTFKNVE